MKRTHAMKEILRRANFVLDGVQGWEAQALRKELVNIANIALAETSDAESKERK